MGAQTNSPLLERRPNAPLASEVKPKHTWPAAVALYLLAPLVAELLSGSTPPLSWNNIGGVMLTLGLYGSGALLAREIVRLRGLSWGNLALLGIAYGALEEGVAYQSWFNPRWILPPDAARTFEVNWTFVVGFTTIHLVLSIITSIVLAEALFPAVATRPWLGRAGRVAFALWLSLIVLVLALTNGFVNFHGKGYDHPPVTYAMAPALFVVFLLLGTLVRIPPMQSAGNKHPPHLWSLRLAGFLGGCIVLINLFFVRVLLPIPVVPIVIIVATDLIGVYVVRRWAQRPGWGIRHRLALVSGVMGVFMVFAPILEFLLPNSNARGLTLINLLALGGLIFLTCRLARFEPTASASTTSAMS